MLETIGLIAGGITAIYGLVRLSFWVFQKTSAQVNAKTDQDVAAEKAQAEETGRPV